ncbi:hypothetical protein [Methylomonas sp. HYX-M1]|uniref:carboxylate--amine ligase n=1 Tax=Methylomonas sp. HYX-M1 TaxID=3139307 RepID=UPI00345BE300
MQSSQSMQTILLGADSPIGLTMIRELGRAGIKVHGIGWGKGSVGLYSKYLESAHYRQSGQLVEQLNAIAEAFACPWIMAVSEDDIMFLQRNRDALQVQPIVPSEAAFAAVVNKNVTLEAARQIGIDTPKTWRIKALADLEGLASELSYPLILKWDNPHAVKAKIHALNRQVDKFRYVYDPAELKQYLTEYDVIGEFPLIQEYCPGYGLGQMFLASAGRVILRFQHQRIAEWPPEGGVSVVCRSLGLDLHQELMAKSAQLLQTLDWTGPAMVEYRYDPIRQRAVLMEINGRFWGSLPLAYYAGVPFVSGWFLAATGGQQPEQPQYQANVQCRYLVPECKRLMTILLFPDRIQNKTLRFSKCAEISAFLRRFFRADSYYYVFSWDDPKPFLFDLVNMLRKLFRL